MALHIETIAYKAPDGTLFACEEKCKEYCENLLGEELDGLLKLFKLEITRHQEFQALLGLLKNQKELKPQILKIAQLLTFSDDSHEYSQ